MGHNRFLALTMAACAIALLVQQPAKVRAQSGQPKGDEANYVIAEGCLQRSGWQYFLYERDGTQEQLTSYPKLKDFVGHEIEITGARGVRTVDNTPPGGASSVITHPVINVKTVKDLGKGCLGGN
jgi:hypothetical protein